MCADDPDADDPGKPDAGAGPVNPRRLSFASLESSISTFVTNLSQEARAVRHRKIGRVTSAPGQSRRFGRQRTSSGPPSTPDILSAGRHVSKCQHRKFAASFDHLVSTGEQRRGHREAQRFGGPQVDDQFEFRNLLHRQISRLVAFQDAAGIEADLPVGFRIVSSIAQQTAGLGKFADGIDCGDPVARCQCHNLIAVICEHGVAAHQERINALADKRVEGLLEFARRTGLLNSLMPNVFAAAIISRTIASSAEALPVGVKRNAIDRASGINSCKNSMRLISRGGLRVKMPVTLPPGRFRLTTKPLATGSKPVKKTTGIDAVAARVAHNAGPEPVMIAATRACANSLARAGSRSAS
jgi:hypothetical protein